MREAIAADLRYARPVIRAVTAAAYARPSSESYGSPRAMRSAPSSRLNLSRLSEARLHAESSMDMYSEHGLDALMRPVFGSVCHELMVVSYWMPGSAQRHAASAACLRSSRAGTVFTT